MKKKHTLFRILYIIFGLIFVSSMLFYFQYNQRPKKPRQISHEYITFHQWVLVHDDGTREEVILPGPVNCKEDEKLVMEAVLPDNLTDAEWINYTNSFDCDLYIDGKLRKSFRASEVDLPGGAVKSIEQFCRLSSEDSNKVIRLERPNKISYVSQIYIGDSLGLVSMYLLNGAPTYIVTFVLIVFCILVIILGIILRKLNHQENTLFSLGLGVLVGSLWFLFDAPLYQFVFDNFYIDGTMSYIMAMLLAFPFLACVDVLEERRHTVQNAILGGILLLNALVQCALHFSGIMSFTRTLLVSNVIICLVMIAFIVILITDVYHGKIDNKVQVIGLFLGLVCGVIEVILINVVDNRLDGPFILLGLWVILLSAVVQQGINLWNAEKARQKAVHANQAKTDFLAKMSHEIRTPINAVLGMDEMILRESSEEVVKQYASDIKIAANNLLEIINEILDSSKIESGKMEIVPVKYHISYMLNDLYNMIVVKAKERKLSLVFDVDETIPSEYFGDDQRIQQVLVNLLTNAVKYTEKGTVTFTLRVKKVEDKAILSFSVKDTGIGIREKDIEALFSEYQRIDEKRNKYVEGTGLGMSITTQLLTLMGSQLKVESTYGVGSMFSFDVEQKIENHAPLGDFRKSKERNVEAAQVMNYEAPEAKILIVDDNKINRRVFVALTKKVKMQVTDVESGKLCLEQICKEKYDIIFLDHMMPEMDGIETLGRMKQLEGNRNLTTPVIMFTANAIQGAREFYTQNGATDYLTKPVQPTELDAIFMKYLNPDLIKMKN